MDRLERFFPKSADLVSKLFTDLIRSFVNVIDVMKMRVDSLVLRFQSDMPVEEIEAEGMLGYGRSLVVGLHTLGLTSTTIALFGVGIAVMGIAIIIFVSDFLSTSPPLVGIKVKVNENQGIDESTQVQKGFSQFSQPIVGQHAPQIQDTRFIPPHLVLIKYIYPTSSIWPPHYLQAFARAQASQLSTIDAHSGTQTHMDTPPAANTRRMRDETAKKWNGKIVLSKKGVRRDLQDGKVGLRAGVKLGDEGDQTVSVEVLRGWLVKA